MLCLELDRVPLWRGDHVAVGQLWEDFVQYLYLPRLRDAEVLLAAVRLGVADLAWEQETFAYAESYDGEAERYRGLKAGQHTEVTMTGLVVKPEAARRQLEAELREREAAGALPGATGVASVGEPAVSDATVPGVAVPAGLVGPEGGQETRPVLRRFHGSVRLDPKRLSRDAGMIADEVVQQLVKHAELQKGASVEVTLEIQADLPEGAPEDLVRTITENCRTLKFDSQGFEEG